MELDIERYVFVKTERCILYPPPISCTQYMYSSNDIIWRYSRAFELNPEGIQTIRKLKSPSMSRVFPRNALQNIVRPGWNESKALIIHQFYSIGVKPGLIQTRTRQ